MTARQPRRTRRRSAPASALPRPNSAAVADAPSELEEESSATRSGVRRRLSSVGHRTHHVTKDYTYVHRDLLTILGVGVTVLAFIVGMSFVVA